MSLPNHLEVPGVRLERLIGRGASSTVYLGTQQRFGRKVAVKVLERTPVPADSEDRFRTECRTLGQLSEHPSIVTVLDGDRLADGTPYLVLAYLPGGTLADRVRREGPSSPADVARTGVRLAGALESAHRLGIVHGDVKPQNVMWTPTGDPALVDFGVARPVAGGSGSPAMVTPAHAAPELLDGAAPSVASDVYGLASTLYEALTGSAPVRDDETHHAEEGGLDGAPEMLAATLLAALDPDPSARPPTAAALGEALRAAEVAAGDVPTDLVVLDPEALDLMDLSGLGLDDGLTMPPPPASPPPGRRPSVVAAATLATVALLGALGLWWFLRDTDRAGRAVAGAPLATSTSTSPRPLTSRPGGRTPTTASTPTTMLSPSMVGRPGGLQPNVDLNVQGVTSTARILADALSDQAMYRALDPGAVALDYPEDVQRFPARVQFQFYNADLKASCPGFLSAPSVIRGSITKGVKWGPKMDNLAVVFVRQFEDVPTTRAALAGVALALAPKGEACAALPTSSVTEVDPQKVGPGFRVDLRDPVLTGLSDRFDDYVSASGANEDPRWVYGFKAVGRIGTMLVAVATNTVGETGQVPAATIEAMMNALAGRLPPG